MAGPTCEEWMINATAGKVEWVLDMVTDRTEFGARDLCSKIQILAWFLAGH